MSTNRIVGIAVVIGALALPILLSGTRYEVYAQHVAVQIMLLGVLAMSWDFTFGFLGMFSFGHAACFGTGAYVAGILVAKGGITSLPLVLLLAVACAALVGLIMGYLSARVGAVAVFLVTFACNEAIYLIVLSDPGGLTNGDNGLLGILPEPFIGLNLRDESTFYYLALAVLITAFGTLRWLTRSRFGLIMAGIRDNETRVRFAGYRVEQYKAAAFGIAGAFAGMAGVLTAFHERIAAPEMAAWLYSADAVLYATLGGIGTLIGPVIGAGVVTLARELLSDFLDSWLIFVGLTYLFLIYFLPAGLYSLVVTPTDTRRDMAVGRLKLLARCFPALRHGQN